MRLHLRLPRVLLLLNLALAAGSATAASCGAVNQRPCKVWERIPSCDEHLVESFSKGKCLAKAVPGKDCGRAGQRPCKVWERVPSCNANLKEDFAKGVCVAVNCGKRMGRPCTVVERIPSCDQGLVENFLKGRCVPSADAERHRIAGAKLQQLGAFIAGKVGYATRIANDPQVRRRLDAKDKTGVANAVDAREAGTTTMPDGHLLRTLTVGASGGAKVLFVGSSGGAGAAIDLRGTLPVHAYATGDYNVGLGLAAGGGIDVGFWVCQVNKIGGDSWGVEFGVDDLAAAYVGAASLKKGPSLGVALWFGYDNVFQGFTITPGFGVGADFGGVVKAATAVQDDPAVTCDGQAVAAAGKPPLRRAVQTLRFGGHRVEHLRMAGPAMAGTLTRVCLENYTNRPKSLRHAVSGVGELVAVPGRPGCANFPASTRLDFDFTDDGRAVHHDAMNLSAYAGEVVVFEWREAR